MQKAIHMRGKISVRYKSCFYQLLDMSESLHLKFALGIDLVFGVASKAAMPATVSRITFHRTDRIEQIEDTPASNGLFSFFKAGLN